MSVPVTELGTRLAEELWRSGLPRPKALEVGRVFEDLQRDRDDLVELCTLLGPEFYVVTYGERTHHKVASNQDYEGLGSATVDPDVYERLEALWRRLGPSDG